MRILVTGSNGMLGKDLCPTLEDTGYEVIKTDIHNLDVTDAVAVSKVLKESCPDTVIHCAAYTNVDKAEEDYETAEKINAFGTENIAKTCAEIDIPIVYISTDYVFDGTKSIPYTPDDIPNPVNNYGLTKLQGEKAVKKYCKKYYIVRTSWLYGHHGKNFIETIISLLFEKPEIHVVNDQTGCPTWTVELAKGITKLFNKPYGTYHVCGSGYTTWYGFAKEIKSRLSEEESINCEILPCTTDEFPRPARRPKYSVMENQTLCADWKIALRNYMSERKVKLQL